MRYLAAIFILGLCVAAYAGTTYDLEAAGDHSAWAIVNDIKAGFEKSTGISLHLVPEIAIVGKGCGKGTMFAESGVPGRFGLICCELDKHMLDRMGLRVYPFAEEPLAIIVNRKNPVNNLTLKQLRGIFSGRITNWKQVGGPNETIAVITQLHCPDMKPNWKKLLPSPAAFTSKRVEVKAQPEMARIVSDYGNAIGHLEMTSVMESGLRGIKIISVNGLYPNTGNMARGAYPLYGILSVVTKGEAKGKELAIIDYLRKSPGAKAAMEKYGMVQK